MTRPIVRTLADFAALRDAIERAALTDYAIYMNPAEPAFDDWVTVFGIPIERSAHVDLGTAFVFDRERLQEFEFDPTPAPPFSLAFVVDSALVTRAPSYQGKFTAIEKPAVWRRAWNRIANIWRRRKEHA